MGEILLQDRAENMQIELHQETLRSGDTWAGEQNPHSHSVQLGKFSICSVSVSTPFQILDRKSSKAK